MKKLFTLFFALFVLGAFSGSAQELIYAENWDNTNSETAILSTQLGGADPGLVVAADNFVVPEGEAWTILELWHRGYVSADAEGNPLAAPDGFSFHIFSDANGAPDTLVVQETFMGLDATADSIALAPTETLELQAGTYWLAFTGYYESAADLSNAGWNVTTWRASTDPLNGLVPFILDEGNLLGLDASGWQPATDLGLEFGALDFAIWGTMASVPQTYTVTFNVMDEQGAAVDGAVIHLGPFTNEAGDYIFEEVPAGTHDYMVVATGYAFGEGQVTVEGDMTVDVTLTAVDNFTVTFTVQDEAENPLENATIVLGPFTNDAGNYVFPNVPPGTHTYTVSLADYPDVTADVEVTDADVEVVVVMVPAAETFPVTFNVDMQGAVAQDDIVFDPAVHSVYIAGSFPGDLEWNQPGSNPELQLMPAGGGETKAQEQVFYEGFETETLPEGWVTIDADGDGNGWFIIEGSEDYTPVVGNYAVVSESWRTDPLTPDNWLITPQITGVGEDYQLMYQVGGLDPDYAAEKYDVLVSTTGTEPEDFTSIHSETLSSADIKQVTLDLAQFAGEDIYIAFRHWDITDQYVIVLEEVIVEGTPGGGEPMIYTITLDLPAADYMYKYFLVADAPSWDIGEWAGDPNREVTVSEAMTIEDVFGQQPGTSVQDLVAEQGLVVYPNPSGSVMNVASAQLINEIRIFDLAGRMVYSQSIEDFNAVINVNQLNDGVYFMQVYGEKSVETQKIQVMK